MSDNNCTTSIFNCEPSSLANNPCPIELNAQCVIYTGLPLSCLGVYTNDKLDVILTKIDEVACLQLGGGGTPLSLLEIGSAPNVYGATLFNNFLNLEPASSLFGGVVNTLAQSFKGVKLFVDSVGVGISPNNRIQVVDLINFDNAIVSTFLGQNAGKNFPSPGGAMNNTFVGHEAGKGGVVIAPADENVGVGGNSLKSITAGFQNTAAGYRSLESLTTGLANSAFGYTALNSLTAGESNAAFGWESLRYSTANFNSGFGYRTLWSTTTGEQNTAVGFHALRFNTTGNYNVSMGANSSFFETVGSFNVSVGTNTLFHNDIGNFNTFVGALAGCKANIASFPETIPPINISSNVFIGYKVGGIDIATGANNNILIGTKCAENHTTGAKNIIIGDDINISLPAGNNQLNIGNIIFGTGVSGTLTTIAGNIGIGIVTPDSAALLDLTSTTKGFLPPRMTDAQKGAIAAPIAGLTVYVSDGVADDTSTGVIETYNGATWKKHW